MDNSNLLENYCQSIHFPNFKKKDNYVKIFDTIRTIHWFDFYNK
jgi:hypothetical protein